MSGTYWTDTRNATTYRPEMGPIRAKLRRRSGNKCEQARLDPTGDQCPAYGVDATRYDDGGTESWVWLCGPHGVAQRREVQ